MTTLQRYLVRQLASGVAASVVVLLLVSLGGVFADLVSEIARGRIPAPLLFSQLGLRVVVFLPMVLPLGLFVGLILAIGRLYRDSEMAVLAALGQGPRQLLGPLLVVGLPVVGIVALLSLWGGRWPSASRARPSTTRTGVSSSPGSTPGASSSCREAVASCSSANSPRTAGGSVACSCSSSVRAVST